MDEQLKEKLICVLKTNAGELQCSQQLLAIFEDYSFNNIYLKRKILSHCWISYEGSIVSISLDEWREILKLREEKIKERQLKDLEKLCVSQE
jgi:hypothetical protein